MTKTCCLETDGYRIEFALYDTHTPEYVDLRVELLLEPHLGNMAMKSIPTFVAWHDVQRLIGYFEAHIAQLQQNPDYVSSPFVPIELGFQIHALAGEVSSADEGEFSLQCFVNVGTSREANHRVYVGGESVVTLKNLRPFLAALQEVSTAWVHTPGVTLA